MNYIVLNGAKSTNIKGLMIQTLPPVTKPLIRTSVEEVDGRDGDIVTKLGYSAYNKELSIGLYGDYDIDQVIQFFDSEGTVILSNEPDKFYRYQIIEQIDFEKLIRFKTATVTLHVQPFKFSAVDNAEKVIASGSRTSSVIHNRGNIYSKPTITIHGTGSVTISINSVLAFTINMTGIEKITIDGESMNAYDGDVYLNRRVSGSYDNLRFIIGSNALSWTGNVSMIEIENFSRWI